MRQTAIRLFMARCNLACPAAAARVCTLPVVLTRLEALLGMVVAGARAGGAAGVVAAAGRVLGGWVGPVPVGAAGVRAGGGARPACGVDLVPMVRAGALRRTARASLACGDAPMLSAAVSGPGLLPGGGELGSADGTAGGCCRACGGWVAWACPAIGAADLLAAMDLVVTVRAGVPARTAQRVARASRTCAANAWAGSVPGAAGGASTGAGPAVLVWAV